MNSIRIISAVGARPNFIKIAPFVRAIAQHNKTAAERGVPRIEHHLVHTGQHYDHGLSQVFFDSLGIPPPDTNLGVGSGSHAEQVGRTMIAFEPIVRDWRPHWVVVVGDVNATCACSLTAKKECLRVAHIEAGLRSFDQAMPEEINRIVTDRLSDLLFTPDAIADANLAAEGVAPERIRLVGNIMVDTLDAFVRDTEALVAADIVAANRIALARPLPGPIDAGSFALLTLHRPSNVDDREILARLVDVFCGSRFDGLPLVWSLHPRTAARLDEFDLRARVDAAPNIVLVEPLAYLDMLKLNTSARLVLTDSGGLQEECCVVGTPCITLRDTTERPVTLREHGGVSELAGNNPERILELLDEFAGLDRAPSRPPLWDGRTAERIVAELVAASADGTR